MEQNQKKLRGKLSITAVLRLESGLHIGGASDFAPIGAVDSPFIRDPLTQEPVIPGSSLKGKMRSLLARALGDGEGYGLQPVEDDPEVIRRLFGSAAKGRVGGRPSRLQFFDLFLTDASRKRMGQMDLDTYYGEVKFENGIDRITAAANPRQIERVPAGAEFAFRLVYNIEVPDEMAADVDTLADGFALLTRDYLGGSGSRGYGRVSFHDFAVSCYTLQRAMEEVKEEEVAKKLAYLRASSMVPYLAAAREGKPFPAVASFGAEDLRVRVADREEPCPYRVGSFRFSRDAGLYLLASVETEAMAERLFGVLSFVGLSGIGGKRTSGFGKFTVEDPYFLEADDPEADMAALYALRHDEAAPWQMAVASVWPLAEEIVRLGGGAYQLRRAGGFVTESSEGARKKDRVALLAEGSCLRVRLRGQLGTVGAYAGHPVYRCGRGLFVGVRP